MKVNRKYLKESLNEDLFDIPRDIADSICKYLDSKNFHNYELVDYDFYPMNTSKITFEVDGDWKHDHLHFKDLVYDWSFDNNKSIHKMESELVRDDGSDSYASDYFIYVTENEDSLKELKSMSKLFSEDYEEESLSEGLDPWYGKYVPMMIGGSKGEPRKVYFYFDSTNFEEAEEEFFDIIPEPYVKAKLYGRASESSLVRDGWKNINESLKEEFITAQDVEEARRVLKNPKKLSLKQIKNLQNLIKKYKEQESSNKSLKNESLNEASYGGAFDIEDDMYFTKEELVEFAGDIAEEFSKLTGHMNCDVDNVYMENDPLAINVDIYDPKDEVSHSAYTRIDMRKIRKPSDIYKYMDRILKQLEDSFHEYHGKDFEQAD